ncbi:DUF262 domain-containing protein [Glacieibacterium frigidum]|uniref:DUF262 domain-containing protein n=1 Tax=Glacieibacterium frigidum TaxID=2593303 RepID=A0A552UG37_9SPHN|nr:DUF262 domain-containing protein [Glacieibacterium frigidum]TRW17167.1 DUF262 domain-containing protein [Glacieibacterium frigidum]
MSGKFDFDSMGIGDLLKRGLLTVPANQRSYAWGEKQVRELLQDLNEAITNDDPDYFLGTVVLVMKDDGVPSIADGQQRIATTSIILARMRDLQTRLRRGPRAQAIENTYLREIDVDTEEHVPKLRMNIEDNEFYANDILQHHGLDQYNPKRTPEKIASNEKLKKASSLIVEFLDDVIKPLKPEQQSDYLNRWLKFIKERASVVVVTAPDEVGAYRMFETLNDRGLKASQADILKNFLFSKAPNRLNEAQSLWSAITGAIESLGDPDGSRLVTYIRHYWIVINGPTKERELAASVKIEISNESKALSFLKACADGVNTYVALWSSNHPYWSTHRPKTRNAVDTIAHHLQIEQIRPLMFAVALKFSVNEAEKAFRLFVSWSVRFLVFGGRGGMLDSQYSLRAAEIGDEKIKTAAALRTAMSRYVPTDPEFETAFATARVSRARLARYYLRAIENEMAGTEQPEMVPNEDVESVNLEHVVPLTPGDSWGLSDDEAEAVQKLIGNLALMQAGPNSQEGNGSFADKKKAYGASQFKTTSMIASFEKWDASSIRARQSELAKLAVGAWPLAFK